MLVSGMASAARVPRPEAFTPKESPAAEAKKTKPIRVWTLFVKRLATSGPTVRVHDVHCKGTDRLEGMDPATAYIRPTVHY